MILNCEFRSIIFHMVIDMDETRPQTIVCDQLAAASIEHKLWLDPFAHSVFVFGNRRKDHFKVLCGSRNSFVIH